MMCLLSKHQLWHQSPLLASAGGRTISDHMNMLKSDIVEALICLQDWLKAVDDEEGDYLVFYQGSECDEETDVPPNQSTTGRSDLQTAPSD